MIFFTFELVGCLKCCFAVGYSVDFDRRTYRYFVRAKIADLIVVVVVAAVDRFV